MRCLFFTIFICNTYSIYLNSLRVNAQDSDELTLTHFGGKECVLGANSSSPKSNCVAVNPYDKFSIECKPKSKSDDKKIVWFQALENNLEKASEVQSSEKIEIDDEKLIFKSVDVVDARFYFCRLMRKDQDKFSSQLIEKRVEVQIIPRVANLRRDVTAIEENPITLNCTVSSSVPLKIVWRIDTPYGDNKTFSATKGRIELMGNNDTFMNNMLVIKSANMTLDRGSYSCWAESDYGNSTTSMMFHLRVKSKYAALWPFLGICTEVVILCIIIIIYEKKRDQTELEESDTDQGPEMKSSPDHGQDNVRYRK